MKFICKSEYKPLSVSLTKWYDTTDEQVADATNMEHRITRQTTEIQPAPILILTFESNLWNLDSLSWQSVHCPTN